MVIARTDAVTGDGPGQLLARVVTDGAADLPEELGRSLGIAVVQGPVHLGGRPWSPGPQETWRAFAQPVGELPVTEAPSPEALGAAYAGDRPVLAVHVSAELSRTCANARVAANRTEGTVEVVDTRSVSVGTGLVALAAAELIAGGAPWWRLLEATRGLARRAHVYAVVDDAELLERGGRAGLVAATVQRHHRRHLIAVRGHAVPICQVRHRSEVVRALLEHVSDCLDAKSARWCIAHANASDIREVLPRLAGVFGCDPTYVTGLQAHTACHLGPQALVVGFFSPL